MPNQDISAAVMPARLRHASCTSGDTTGQPIHSHSHSQTLKPPKPPGQGEGISAGLTLRPYQSAAVQNLRLSLAGGVLRDLLYSATGSGKTEMGMAIVRGAVRKGKRVIFLCNRVHLVEQTSRRFTKAGIAHGIIQGENTTRVYENVLVASIQTIARRGLPDVDLIIIDEAHTVAGSRDYRQVIFSAKGIPVIGLSATPYAKGLGKYYAELRGPLFEHMTVAAKISELIADGYLVDVDVYAPSEPDMSVVRQTRNALGEMDFSDTDAARAANKPELVGDIVTHWLRLAAGTPTVCFASGIPHSKNIVERFLASGVPAEHLDCYCDDEERQAILRRMESGETLVISNVGILVAGWDMPACRTLILARPTRSLTCFIQMAGRVLRPYPGKDRALILDHSGVVQQLGYPTDDFPLELDDGTPKEARGTQKRETPLPKACPSCSYVKTAHKCPVCGFAPERRADVDVRAGELVLLDRRKRKAPLPDKQDFYSQLLTIAEDAGYKPGWVANKYRERFTVWPRGLKDIPAPVTQSVKDFLKHTNIRYSKRAGVAHANA